MSDNKSIKNKNEIPLLFRNLKKKFGNNIKGPFRKEIQNYQATTTPLFLDDIAEFFKKRYPTKLAAITAWENGDQITIAYHYINQGNLVEKDSKITIFAFIEEKNKKIPSIIQHFPMARVFEKEITEQYKIVFTQKDS
ncbi:MAG: NADH-quinone oxidoreductase subunit C [Asgard group archaeon]|nr:NADH-quinone oxidoreductase subunit C [Asgard group archaeon]